MKRQFWLIGIVLLPKQIIFENLTVEKKLSRMHNDMDEIVKSLTKCRDKIEWKKK